MNAAWPRLLVTLLLGLVIAGPLAAVAIVATPSAWRGPSVPAASLILALLLAAWVRHRPRRGADGPRSR